MIKGVNDRNKENGCNGDEKDNKIMRQKEKRIKKSKYLGMM